MTGRRRESCRVPGCIRPGRLRRGYCEAHYWRLLKGADMTTPLRARIAPQDKAGFCSIEGCGREFYAKNLCRVHWHRLLKGTVDMESRPKRRLAYPAGRLCETVGCDRRPKAWGLCHACYKSIVRKFGKKIFWNEEIMKTLIAFRSLEIEMAAMPTKLED